MSARQFYFSCNPPDRRSGGSIYARNEKPVKPHFDSHHFYFVTTTAVGYAHLFKRDVIKRIILDSLHHIRTSRGMKLFVFVIMPSHIHKC